jgi:hypothetical protein
MRYMMLIYSQEDDTPTSEGSGSIAAGHRAVMDEAHHRGILRAADPLAPSATATVVRVRDGGVLVTDGPYAETKEQLAGYYILDCEDLDEALAWAAKIPTGCAGRNGCIEVRPLRELPQQVQVNG